MVRKVDETHREFKARKIDTVSDSFCGAKWFNATIWLGHGGTTSCHHPPAHQIDTEEIKTNPSAIHNTRHKKKMRDMMQKGDRPKECEYCWKIEDMGQDSDGNEPVSDRVYNIDCKLVMLHQGIIAQTQMAQMLRCAQVWNERQQCWQTKADVMGYTSIPGVQVAGDGGCIGGALLAQIEGRVAGMGRVLLSINTISLYVSTKVSL